MIFDILTPEALAHWIITDGSRKNDGVILCTDSFTIIDVVRLVNVLIVRYQLDCTIHTPIKGPRIYIKGKSMPLLRSIVLPYMHNSMLYKIGL